MFLQAAYLQYLQAYLPALRATLFAVTNEQIKWLEALPLEHKQARYFELAQKVAQVILLTEEEMLELVVLREALQQVAAEFKPAKQI
jgi:hypothetical protein